MPAVENQHKLVVSRLRAAKHDVEWIAESETGMRDVDILRRTDIATLVLLTFDRDFGDLVFNQGQPVPRAIIYTRLSRAAPETIADRLLTLLAEGMPESQMTTITKDGFRSRPSTRRHEWLTMISTSC